MSFLAPLLPALIPLGIQLLGKAVGGDDEGRKKMEWSNMQDPEEAAMRKKLFQMAMMEMGKPMGEFSSYGQGAASIFGMQPQLPGWWAGGSQMPGGIPGMGTAGKNPWTQMPKGSLQAPQGGKSPGGGGAGLPVR
jgi:hypothetical protein